MVIMRKKFEDDFMELQSEFISLCLEVAEQEVNEVYAYCSIEKKSTMFNAFFTIDGEIKTLNQLGINNNLIMQFLKMGTRDLEKIKEVCNNYNMPIPTEIKMYYDTNTRKYDAECRYDEVCSSNTGISAGEVFMDWISEIKEKRQSLFLENKKRKNSSGPKNMLKYIKGIVRKGKGDFDAEK